MNKALYSYIIFSLPPIPSPFPLCLSPPHSLPSFSLPSPSQARMEMHHKREPASYLGHSVQLKFPMSVLVKSCLLHALTPNARDAVLSGVCTRGPRHPLDEEGTRHNRLQALGTILTEWCLEGWAHSRLHAVFSLLAGSCQQRCDAPSTPHYR